MLKIFSPAFHNGTEIPSRFAGDGENLNPPLQWSNVPNDTREFALICIDPDAATPEPFVHWILYNIPGDVDDISEGLVASESIELPVRADQGRNSWKRVGYGGPMPPVGDGAHHYIFRLFALDTELGLAPGASQDDLMDAMQGHVIEVAETVGTYERGGEQATPKKIA